MFNIIRQKNLVDCGVCCLAMAIDKPYKEILKQVNSWMKIHEPKEKFTGMTAEIETSILWKFDIKFTHIYTYEKHVVFQDGYWIPKRDKKINLKKIVGDKKALLSCPSINFKGKGHAVYWDGKKLHDPSNMKRFTARKAFDTAYAAVVLK